MASPRVRGRLHDPRDYRRIDRTLEDGKFHLAFFDDRLAMPNRFGDDFAESVRHGVRVAKMDPIPVLSVMGAETTRLGLGATGGGVPPGAGVRGEAGRSARRGRVVVNDRTPPVEEVRRSFGR